MNNFKPIHFFIHPLPLLAVVLTAVNDHYLKYQYPGFITGKLSDFTGLFYFPLFIAAVVVLVVRIFNKKFVFNRALLLYVITVTDIIFCVFKLNPEANAVFVKWFSENIFLISAVSDPTDLIALVSSVGCYYFGCKFIEAEK